MPPADRRPYETPSLKRLDPWSPRKHPVFDLSATETLDGAPDLAALTKEFGSPLFVVSEAVLRARYRAFLDTFAAPGIQTRIAYSVKTNYLPAVVAVMLDEGAMAEVVSGMEYQMVRALGVPGADIVFNGPHKTRDELARAIEDGALIHADGFGELETLDELTRVLGRTARIGIRVNFKNGAHAWTRFGFNFDAGEAVRALERIAAAEGLALESLHCHAGTFLLDPDVHGRAAEVLVRLNRTARSLGLAPTIIDVGGGFPSDNRLKSVFDPEGRQGGRGNQLAPFAEKILSPVMDALDDFDGPPILALEPGRALVDQAVQLACTVVAVKDIPDKGPAVVVDAGVNLLPTAAWYEHPLAAESANGDERPVTVYGPLCMQIDVVREKANLPPLAPGDVIAVSNVGAYCQTQSMQFIQPRPATVMLGPDGPEAVQRRETWRDVFARDAVPERLRRPDADF